MSMPLNIYYIFISLMNSKIVRVTILINFLLSIACSSDKVSETVFFPDYSNTNYMAFDSVYLIKDFPKTETIDSGIEVSKEIIGMWNFEVVDDLMIVSTRNQRGAWEAYTLPGFELFGKFLSVGEGPKELSATPSVSDKVHFDLSHGEKSALIYDFQRGRLLKLFLERSVDLGRDSIQLLDAKLSPYLFDFLKIDSGFYFIRKPENLETQINRYLDSSGVLSTRPVLEELNTSKISGNMNFPILSSMSRLKDGGKTIVEMYFRLNYFNLYSLDGNLKKTICIEDEIDQISVIEELEQKDRTYRFSDVRVYEDYFVLLHLNEKEEDFASKRKTKPEILFFNWEGNPLAKIVSEYFCTSFDIDLVNKHLYTFDSQTDRFKKYDLPELGL